MPFPPRILKVLFPHLLASGVAIEKSTIILIVGSWNETYSFCVSVNLSKFIGTAVCLDVGLFSSSGMESVDMRIPCPDPTLQKALQSRSLP